MYQREPELSDSERRILRGMVDEYTQREARARYFGSLIGDLRIALAVFSAAALIVLQVLTVILTWKGHR